MSRYRVKEKKKFHRFVGILLLIVAVIVAAAVTIHIRTADGYHNERTFQRYAETYFKQIGGSQQSGTKQNQLSYGEPVSMAIQSPKLNRTVEQNEIRHLINREKKRFRAANRSLRTEDQAALLIGYESYKTPYPVTGIAIHEKQRIKKSDADSASIPVDQVHTFNFATKTGTVLQSSQIFQGDYLNVIARKVKSQLSDQYDHLNEKGLTATAAHYSNYVLADEGVRFYFNAGQAAAKSNGVIHTELSYKTLQSVLRSDIGKHVIDPGKPMVAITYDDGPDATCTARILDTYEKYDAVCTFFELGQNVEQVKGAAALLKRELALGCEVGTHSYNHPNQYTLSDAQVRQQADRSKSAIKKACGQEPTIGRPPYGNGSTKIAKIYHLPLINWDIDTLDWKSRNADSVVSQVKRVKHYDGAIILMHSVYASSAKATEELVPWLQSKGYQLVTVSQLLQYHYNETPKKGTWYGYTFETLNQKNGNTSQTSN